MEALRFAGVPGRGHGGRQLDLGLVAEADAVDVEEDLVALPDVDDAVIWNEKKEPLFYSTFLFFFFILLFSTLFYLFILLGSEIRSMNFRLHRSAMRTSVTRRA
jgi:hypothetical protein